MRKFILFLAIVVSAFTTGCASNRTAAVGYSDSTPVFTKNVTGTVKKTVVDGVVEKEEIVENYTIVSTPPVQKRTWREKVFGSRAPAENQVIPAGVGGKNEYPNRPSTRSYGSSDGGYSNGGYNSGGYSSGYTPPPVMYIPRSSGFSVGGAVSIPNPRLGIGSRYGGGRVSIPNPRDSIGNVGAWGDLSIPNPKGN